MKLKRTKQCAKCPWRVDVDPHDIPNGYCPTKHSALDKTIAKDSDLSWLAGGAMHVMACHEAHNAHCVGDGSIWSCWRTQGVARAIAPKKVQTATWTRLRGDPRKEDGRLRYTVKREDGTYRRCYGSHLVLEAFGFGARVGNAEACHGDGNCLNDSISNLRWDTSVGNKVDMKRHGTRASGENHPKTKLSDANIEEVIARRANGETLASIGRSYGVSEQRICQIAKKGGR